MISKEAVKKFIDSHPINTDGAISRYKATIEWEVDDGDVYTIATYLVWSQNSNVVRGIIDLLYDLRTGIYFPNSVDIYFDINAIRIIFYHSVCDPD